MKLNIVELEGGKFAVEAYSADDECVYRLDFVSPDYWWDESYSKRCESNYWKTNCVTDSIEVVNASIAVHLAILNHYKAIGKEFSF